MATRLQGSEIMDFNQSIKDIIKKECNDGYTGDGLRELDGSICVLDSAFKDIIISSTTISQNACSIYDYIIRPYIDKEYKDIDIDNLNEFKNRIECILSDYEEFFLTSMLIHEFIKTLYHNYTSITHHAGYKKSSKNGRLIKKD